ncbi:c-type cytochrome [Brevundimonas nasdae]|uniref:c-type cytochrome n=1 Tax=Brevundimonas nasdae TaxID=172043 RepID=UPI00289DB947|nr:cytochrome c family protein [Brevundimonas nasdae]
MNRFAPLAAAPILMLAACGNGGADTSSAPASAPAKPARVLSDAEKATLLASLPAPYNEGDLENGRRAFARCRSCHTIGEGGPDMAGPNLYGVFGRKAGERPRYSYSNAMRTADFTWDAEKLDHWLQNPRTFLPGNKMTFPGLPDDKDRRDVIAFLKVETGYQAEPAPAPAS